MIDRLAMENNRAFLQIMFAGRTVKAYTGTAAVAAITSAKLISLTFEHRGKYSNIFQSGRYRL